MYKDWQTHRSDVRKVKIVASFIQGEKNDLIRCLSLLCTMNMAETWKCFFARFDVLIKIHLEFPSTI